MAKNVLRRALTTGAAILVAAFVTVIFAPAATAQVIFGAQPSTLVQAAEGSATATVMVINNSAKPTTLTARMPATPTCAVRLDPFTVPAARHANVTVTITGCDVTGGATMLVSATGQKAAASLIFAGPAPAEETTIAAAPLLGGGAAGLVAGALVALTWKRRVVGGGGRDIAWNEALRLDPNWSFDTSWAASLTLGTAGVVGLIAGTDILTGFLGDEARPALLVVAVASAIAALTAGVAPLILKTAGADHLTVTVGGLYLAGALVLTGSITQTVAIAWGVWKLFEAPTPLQVVIWVLALALVVLLIAYAAKSLRSLVTHATGPQGNQDPPAGRRAISAVI